MSYIFANNVSTTLGAAITTTSQTTITLASAANLPTIAPGQVFALTLNDAATQSVFEIVYVTARTGAVLTVLRGQEGTAAQTWLVGDYAYGALTAAELAGFSGGPPAGASFLDTSSGAQTKAGPLAVTGGITAALHGNADTATTAASAAALASPYVAAVANTDGSVTVTDSGPADGATATLAVQKAAIRPVRVQFRLPGSWSPGYTHMLTLPALPGPTTQVYDLYARAFSESSSGSSSLTLSGTSGTGGTGWEAGSPISNPDLTGVDLVEAIGTAVGGDAPAVMLTIPGSPASPTISAIFILEAVPR